MATRATFLRDAVASRTRGLPAAFWTIWCGLVVNRLASFVLPFLSIYLVRDRGFLPAQAGRVLALYGVGVTVAGPLGGFLADRAGRRITMVLALALGRPPSARSHSRANRFCSARWYSSARRRQTCTGRR